jgi:alpha-1,2-mannosyltransferase
MLAVLYAAYSSRWWLSSLLVGVAAGVKLTPAISGGYFVGVRRWAAAVFSGVVSFATLGVSYLVAGDRVRYYFTEWIGRDTVFPIGSVDNQSWRGGFARVLGYDAGTGPQLVAAIAVTGALAVLAWWVLVCSPRRSLGPITGCGSCHC